MRPAVETALALANLREVARQVSTPESKNAILAFAEQAIADFEDDLCPPYRHFGPWPAPPPPWWMMVSIELVSIANASSAPGYRESVLQLAGEIAERGMAAAGNAAPQLGIARLFAKTSSALRMSHNPGLLRPRSYSLWSESAGNNL